MIQIDIRQPNKVNGDYALFMSFPYDETILNIVRSLPSRFWHSDTKEWEVPFNKLSIILDSLNKYEVEVKGDMTAFAEKTVPNIDFTFKTKPYKHQIEGFNYGLTHNKWLLGDEQGCISGDCKVKIKEVGKVATRNIKLKHLYELFQTDKTAQIKCMINGRFGYLPIKTVVDKGIKHTIKIVLDDTSIVCTPDHLIYTDKGWIEAGKLSIGDSIFTNGKQVCPKCGADTNLITYPYSKFLGYCKSCMYQSRNGNKYKDARLIKKIDKYGYVLLCGIDARTMPTYTPTYCGAYEHHQVWYEHTGHVVDVKTEVVHHKNGIKTDNRFENLQLMSIKDHCKLHSATKTSHLYQFNENLDFVTRNGTKIYLVPRLQTVTDIVSVGDERVYDIEIDNPDIHNFICNNIVVHNCGKTKQIIDIAVAKKIEKGYKHCLIVCGVNGLKWNWVNEIRTHSDEDGWILGMYRKTCTPYNPDREVWGIGSNKDKLDDLNKLGNDPHLDSHYFIITNVESLRDEKINAKLQELCKNSTIGMIAVDEIHKCKNAMSQQGKGILKLTADTMIAMTGTPLMNNPLDLYIILRWLGYERHSFYQFRSHYCLMGGYGGYQIVGYQHLDELQDVLNEMMLRRLKGDVLDLPDKVFVDEYVELTTKQNQVYKEILMDLRNNVDKIASAPNPLSQLIRLRQATGYTGILSSDIQESAKLDRMEEIIEEAVENGQKVVVFSNWTSITDEALRRLKRFNPATITGETKDSERPVQERKFQTDPTCKVMVGSIGATGTGLTLTAGTVEIFLDHPWNRALYDQAVDRCHRIGTSQSVTIYNLLTKGTIDERIWEIVQKKGALSDEIIDGKTIDDKRALVDYLLS